MKAINLTDFDINLLISLLHSEVSQDRVLIATRGRWINDSLRDAALKDMGSKEELIYKLEALWNTSNEEIA